MAAFSWPLAFCGLSLRLALLGGNSLPGRGSGEQGGEQGGGQQQGEGSASRQRGGALSPREVQVLLATAVYLQQQQGQGQGLVGELHGLTLGRHLRVR